MGVEGRVRGLNLHDHDTSCQKTWELPCLALRPLTRADGHLCVPPLRPLTRADGQLCVPPLRPLTRADGHLCVPPPALSPALMGRCVALMIQRGTNRLT